MTAFGKLMVKAEKGQSVENLVAKIVCHVELTSDFNTSAVNQLTPGMDDHHSREKREAGYRGMSGKAEREDDSEEQEREDKRRPSKTRPTPATRPTPSTHATTPTYPTPSTNKTNSTLPTTPILPTLTTNLPTKLNQSTTILSRKRREVRHPPSNTHPTLPTHPMQSNHTEPSARPTPLTPPKNSNHPTPPTRPPHLVKPNDPLNTIRPHARERRDIRQPLSNTRPTPPTHPTPFNHPQHLDEEVWTLYGLFQLSNHLVCNDTTLSPNICEMDCNNLLDDDISDDISCLMRTLNQLIAKSSVPPQWKELSKMIRLIFQQECSDQDASEYFAECA
ncbi:cell surface glycoprotein 1-like [Micropterus salmoides]|uniref:cell surface glycoprotein 1-like n=1 Tax=Micropterus salmoides TaxID=27706 RepID=UPI0018EC24A5|nr:cell surface glycoprotein 1-like [Micropterus salmoides]